MAYGANDSHLLGLQIALMVRHFHVPHVYLVTHPTIRKYPGLQVISPLTGLFAFQVTLCLGLMLS